MKFYGAIGFVKTSETAPGVWTEEPEEVYYKGDVLRNNASPNQSTDQVISDFNINNRISILVDDYMRDNLQYIKYVIFMGVKWKVNTIEFNYPRAELSFGGVYQ